MRIRLYHLPVMLPRSQAPHGPLVNVMSMGLVALAWELSEDGHQVEVVHGGVETRIDPTFDVVRDLTEQPVDLVGFSLHWHRQLRSVQTAAHRVRSALPELPVVVGGMTASAFADEILQQWSAVDYVITGEAERGLVELARYLERGHSGLNQVANLAYREAGRPRRSGQTYMAGQSELDALEFARFELLRHHRHYNAQFAEGPEHRFDHPHVFHVPTGRGCSLDCAFCSGGRSGQRALMHRTAVTFRNPARVVQDVERALSFGARTLVFCFDPPPASESYHRRLFDQLAPLARDLQGVFECYRPPSDELLRAFARCFAADRRRLSFSPTVGDESLRKTLLGSPFSNRRLERTLAECRRLDIATTLYFAAVPRETPAQLTASLDWQERLARDFGCRIVCSALELEPGAPWAVDPARYGITSPRQSLADYSQMHSDRPTFGVSYSREVGYDFSELDARLVRVGSRLLSAPAELALAIAYCGQGAAHRSVLAAPGRLDDALGFVGEDAGPTAFVFFHDPYTDSDGLWQKLADQVGPHARVLHIDPKRLVHVRWDGRRTPRAPRERTLTILHLADAVAARRLFETGETRLPFLGQELVLADACRWATQPCPALALGLVAVSRDGSIRCCSSAPGIRTSSGGALAAKLREQARAAAQRRGCDHCPAASSCSRCLFTGTLSETEFCSIRREWALAACVPRLVLEPPWRSQGIAIGWDD